MVSVISVLRTVAIASAAEPTLASPPDAVNRRTARRSPQLWVRDQDEALAFYTEKLGWEVRADYTLPELGDFRWLTVGPPAQPDISVVLMAIPGPPVFEAETADQLRDLMAKGAVGTLFLTTDDCHAAYRELRDRGVEFVEEPEERPYGIDSSLRDPSGNSIRVTQVRQPAAT